GPAAPDGRAAARGRASRPRAPRAPRARRTLRRSASLAPRVAACAVHLALRMALRDGLSLVVRLLAAPDPEQQLGAALGEVELQRHERVALLLERLPELLDLGAVEQQLALPHRVQVPAIALLVGWDVELHHPRLAVLDRGPGLLEARLPRPEALHLGACEHEPGLDRVEDRVVVRGLAILRDQPVAGGGCRLGHDLWGLNRATLWQ